MAIFLKKQSIILLTFFIFFILTENIIVAQNDMQPPCLDDYSQIKHPSYTIFIRNDNPNINRGDMIRLEAYIIGYGNTSIEIPSFIDFSLPDGLFDENKTIGNASYYALDSYNSSFYDSSFIYITQLTPVTQELGFSGGFVRIVPYYYFRQPSYDKGLIQCFSAHVLGANVIHDSNGNPMPPFTFMLKSSDKATFGDHKIKMILSYTDGEQWYQNIDETSVYVNNPLETNRFKINLVLTIIGLLMPISAIVYSGSSEENKKRYKDTITSKTGVRSILIVVIILLLWISYLALNSWG